jgi:hypothetical protein
MYAHAEAAADTSAPGDPLWLIESPLSAAISMLPVLIGEDIPLESAPCRNRNRNRVVHYQLLTRSDSQIDSQKLRSDAMLIELIRLWRQLDERTQRALLGAACAYEISGGTE